MEKTKLKEKDIVKKIVDSWEDYFPQLDFWRTEYALRDFRVDIAANFEVDREAYGLKPSPFRLMAPVFFEVKYNSEMRDLIYELRKQLAFRNFYTDVGGCLAYICVISDRFEPTMTQFMIENNIVMYQINIIDDDIDTLTLTEYNPSLIIKI